jgi:hypothetical protein
MTAEPCPQWCHGSMTETHIDPTARQGRFRRRFVFHDDPQVLEQLQRAAFDEATSAASIVRSAVRSWLREHEDDDQ